MYGCECCWVINDKRKKLEDIHYEEMMTEVAEYVGESTTEPIRKLASIPKISAIEPIEGTDRIVKATIDGWSVVTQKSNGFKVGDLVVYFEIDSFLPVCEKFEFLRSSSFKSTKHLGDGFRIKTIKLKGVLSQGLILPLSEFRIGTTGNCYGLNHVFKNVDVVEGVDLTELLGVKKWEQPLSPQLAGRAKSNFPSWIRKTDQERIQNMFGKIKDRVDLFEVTMKLDGSSMTAYLKDDTFGVCSRNLDLTETPENTFWQVARKYNIEDMMREMRHMFALGDFAIQGELIGPGVNGNYDEFGDHYFYLFDIFNIDTQKYFDFFTREFWYVKLMSDYIRHVPIIEYVSPKEKFRLDIQNALNYADIPSIHSGKPAEGVVLKSTDGTSFKIINNKFLLSEK